jgi:hypothetical protein
MKKPTKPKIKSTKRHDPDFDVLVLRFTDEPQSEPVITRNLVSVKRSLRLTIASFGAAFVNSFRHLTKTFRWPSRRSS